MKTNRIQFMEQERKCVYCSAKFNFFNSLGKLDCKKVLGEHKKQDHFDIKDEKFLEIKIQDLLDIILSIPDKQEFFNRPGIDKENGIVRRVKFN